MSLTVNIVNQLEDNYSYLVSSESGESFVIDPADETPLVAAIHERKLILTTVVNSHHHSDHTAANLALKRRYGVRVYAHEEDRERIPGVDVGLAAQQKITLSGVGIEIIGAPGHTRTHLLIHVPSERVLFTGDTLFLLGCGRIFGGTAAALFTTLQTITALPDDTLLYCGHEYTLQNARFAESVLGPNHSGLERVAAHYRARRERGEPTVPGRLGDERVANPFLLAVTATAPESSTMKTALGLAASSTPLELFTALREARSAFR